MVPDVSPDDFAYSDLDVQACCTFDEGVFGENREVSKTKRANAISWYAGEVGVSFREVRCTVRYLRFLTRQDVWEEHGRRERMDEDLVWSWIAEDPDNRTIATAQENAPRAPAECPADHVFDGEYDPAWEFCKKDTPGAIKIYHCEVRS